MHYDICGGCRDSTQKHKKHCRFSPDYTYSAEYADQLNSMGDFIGPNDYELANLLWEAAGRMREYSKRELASRRQRANLRSARPDSDNESV